MKRVMIIGQPGSGKSTLARRLGDKMGLPVYHMDHIHWMHGWVERAKPEKIAMAHAIENRDEWIFEGGLSATYDHRVARCDTLINLDFPLWLRAWRVGKRTILSYGRTRSDLPDGCPEYFDPEFWHYIWRTRKSGQDRQNRAMASAGANVVVHHLRGPQQVRAFLASA
jgi:adenylate kinase family enzyme